MLAAGFGAHVHACRIAPNGAVMQLRKGWPGMAAVRCLRQLWTRDRPTHYQRRATSAWLALAARLSGLDPVPPVRRTS